MPRVLKDIRINEVSSVDRGAGEGVKMLLMKRDKGADVDPKELEKLIATAVTKAVETATAPLNEAINKLKGENVILKMSPTHKAYFDACDDPAKKAFSETPEGDRDAYMKKNPIKKIEKSEDPAVAELQKRNDDLAAANATMAKRLGALEEIETKASFEKRAVAMGLKADQGDLIRKAYSGDTEAQGKLDKLITETNKALGEARKLGGLFKIVGDDRDGGEGATAYDKMKALATEYRKTADGAKLSEQQAFSKVYDDPANRTLREEVMAEDVAKRASAA